MSQDPSTEFWRSQKRSCRARIQECELCTITNTAPIGTKGRGNGARVAQEFTINANRSNVRATIRVRLFTKSIKQVQMASIQAFQGLQLMMSMRQHVFAHMERGSQRGYADVTPEVELRRIRGEPPQVETANEIQRRAEQFRMGGILGCSTA